MISFTVPNLAEFMRFEPGADGRNLLSSQQAEPAAAFAELLELDVDAQSAPPGQPLPLTGNGLPLPLSPVPGTAGNGAAPPGAGTVPAAPPATTPAVAPAPIGHAMPLPDADGRSPAPAAMLKASLPATPAADRAGAVQATAVTGADGDASAPQAARPVTPEAARDTRPAPALPALANTERGPVPPGSGQGAPRVPAIPVTELARAAGAAGRERPVAGPGLPGDPVAARPQPATGELTGRSATPATAGTAPGTDTSAATGLTDAAGRAPGATAPPAAAGTDLGGPAAQASAAAGATAGTVGRPTADALPQTAAPRAVPIEVPVGDPGWADEVGQRLRLVSGAGLQTAEIRLTPAELGPLRIQVAVDDGAASVSFIAQHAVTRDAIEQALPRLREMLADNGLTLAQTSVGGEGVPQGQRDAGRAATADGYRAPEAAADAEAGTPARRREPVGLVDTFA